MTRYSPGGGAGTCPLVPGSRASTTLGGEGCHSLAATPRETASSTLARCRPPRSPRPPEWCLGWPAAIPDAAWWLLQGWCASRGRGGGGLNAPPPSLSKRMCCRGRVGWCGSSRALGLVNRFIPERDASPRQEQISAERAQGRFSMPCGAAAMRYGGLEKRGFDFGQEVYCLQPTERAACCPTCPGVTSCKRTANREIVLLRVGN